MSGDLEGRVAVVPGGAGRLGRAISMELVRAGASVGVFDARAYAGAEVVTAIHASGGKSASVAGDVSRAADVEAAGDALERELRPNDLLGNAPGIFPNRPPLEKGGGGGGPGFPVHTPGTMVASRPGAPRP